MTKQNKELNIIERCVREAGSLIAGAGGDKFVENKGSAKNLVTMYDKAVQEKLYELLSKEFPKAGFLGEESDLNDTEGKKGIFIIDPIDGTTNFIKGLGHSAISVGYYTKGDIKYGCVYNPFSDEMFTAEKGKGAFLNGKKISVSPDPIEKSVALYGTSPYNEELQKKSFRFAREITKKVVDSRRMGAASLDLCYVSCGRAELYSEYLLSPWDYAGGYVIAKEAGAIITDVYGKELPFVSKSSIAVGTPKTYPVLMDVLKKVENVYKPKLLK